ncbi:hypothetical protein O3P69_010058 [Scylla paramamosain]|uniref:Uncharacterized protein n=1 Tax=Scylla paramamosain TaxID=85552 RepID=A0AAW0SQ10_SCYPA
MDDVSSVVGQSTHHLFNGSNYVLNGSPSKAKNVSWSWESWTWQPCHKILASDGATPLHHAPGGGYVAALQLLVDKCGDPYVQSKSGLTPIDVAVQHDVESWLAKNAAVL